MKLLRLTVPSQLTYVLNVLSRRSGVVFPDRQVVDVPLYDHEQVRAAELLSQQFLTSDVRTELANGPDAIRVYHAEVVEV